MGNTVKLRETLVATIRRLLYTFRCVQVITTAQESKDLSCKHQGETHGYGKKVMNRDNPQPSTKASKEAMYAVQRLNVSGQSDNIYHNA